MRIVRFFCVGFLLLSCLPVKAEPKVIAVGQNGFIIENKVTINSPATFVWQTLANDIDLWWPKDHTWWGNKSKLSLDASAGGCFCEKGDSNSAQHMLVTYVEPPKLLRMTGGLGPLQGMGVYGALEWQLEGENNTTVVKLTYRVSGFSPDGFEQLAPIVARVQGLQLNSLAHYIDVNNSN